ncbi:MAG: metal-dependent transcriptional regulator [Spirochaetales bacterium]|jgi:DtxR family Mn-dependent transcriptional regulator|nr:metal-dependent transcriptional regulator [Spirochaetales bacterium]
MKTNTEDLSHSLEDYLEVIYHLEKKNRVARVKDIADAMNVQMPSVTGAIKNLKSKDLVNYEKNSYISLSEKGLVIAESVLTRHSALKDFLQEVLLMPAQTAEEQACKMEHAIDPETALRFKSCTRFFRDEVIGKKLVDSARWKKIVTAKP